MGPWCALGPDGLPCELTAEEESFYGGDRISVRRALGAKPEWGGPEAALSYLAEHGPDADLLSTDHFSSGEFIQGVPMHHVAI